MWKWKAYLVRKIDDEIYSVESSPIYYTKDCAERDFTSRNLGGGLFREEKARGDVLVSVDFLYEKIGNV